MRKLLLVALLIVGGCTKKDHIDYRGFIEAKPNSFDPIYIVDLEGEQILRLVYDTLYTPVYDGTWKVVPTLAEAPPVTEDGKVYQISLKKGVHFKSAVGEAGLSREMTASDVIASIKRIAAPQNASPGFRYLENMIVGLDEWRNRQKNKPKADYSEPVEGLTAQGDYTVRINFKNQFAPVAELFSAIALAIVPREVVEGSLDLSKGPVGTGAYILTSSLGDPFLKFSSRGKKPKILKLEVLKSEDERVQKFKQGESDWIQVESQSALQTLKEMQKVTRHEYPLLETSYLAFNFADKGIRDSYLPLKELISSCLDREELIKNLYLTMAVPARRLVPRGLESRDETPSPSCDRKWAQNLRRKIKLKKIKMALVAAPESKKVADWFQASFKNIDLDLQVEVLEPAELLGAIKKGKIQMWGTGWMGGVPSAYYFYLAPLEDLSGFNDSNYRKALAQFMTLSLNAAGVDSLGEQLNSKSPQVPLSHKQGVLILSEKLKLSPGASVNLFLRELH